MGEARFRRFVPLALKRIDKVWKIASPGKWKSIMPKLKKSYDDSYEVITILNEPIA